MMTLIQAGATNKRIKRAHDEEYVDLEEFLEGATREDILATDYMVEPDRTVGVTPAAFAAAWNTARSGTNGIKPAGESEFYRKLISALGI